MSGKWTKMLKKPDDIKSIAPAIKK